MFGDRVAAGASGARLAVDDGAHDRNDRDCVALGFGRVCGDPVFERDRIIDPRLAIVGRAGDFGYALAKGEPAADLVDQPGVERRLAEIIVRGLHHRGRSGQHRVELCLRPRLLHFGEPGVPQHRGIGQIGLLRLGRLVAAQIRFDRALESADAIDVRGDAEPVHQPLVIEARSAGAGDGDAADAVGPYFARMRGKLIAVGRIGGGEGEHGLLGRPHLVDRSADFGKRHLSAADEAVEVENDGADAVVLRRGFDSADDIAGAIFLHPIPARHGGKRIDLGRLLAQHAVELDDQRALADGQRRIGTAGEQREQPDEKEQEEQEREPVLDRDEQVPNLARKAGAAARPVVARQRAANRNGPGAGGIGSLGRRGAGVGHAPCLIRPPGLGNPSFDGRPTKPHRRRQSQPCSRYQRTVSARALSVASAGCHSAAGGCVPAAATQSGCAI